MTNRDRGGPDVRQKVVEAILDGSADVLDQGLMSSARDGQEGEMQAWLVRKFYPYDFSDVAKEE